MLNAGPSTINPIFKYSVFDEESSNSWQSPKGTVNKFNCDGSWIKSIKRAGMGCVIRDSIGFILVIKASYIGYVISSFEAEGLTLVTAMRWASQLNMQNCSFETDSVELFHQTPTFSDWSGDDRRWISECPNFLMRNDNWTLLVIRREANRVADGVAKRSAMNDRVWSSVLAIPSFIGNLQFFPSFYARAFSECCFTQCKV